MSFNCNLHNYYFKIFNFTSLVFFIFKFIIATIFCLLVIPMLTAQTKEDIFDTIGSVLELGTRNKIRFRTARSAPTRNTHLVFCPITKLLKCIPPVLIRNS